MRRLRLTTFDAIEKAKDARIKELLKKEEENTSLRETIALARDMLYAQADLYSEDVPRACSYKVIAQAIDSRMKARGLL